MKIKKMRLPENEILRWFLKHYGIGGAENYFSDSIENTLKGLALILRDNGAVELEYIGKFLIKLSEDLKKADMFYDELKEHGY